MIANASSYYGTKLEFRCRNYNTNNTNGRYWWAINDISDEDLTTNPQNENPGTQIEGIYINNSSYAFNFNNYLTTIGIGQQRYNQGWGSNSQAVMKVYRYYTRLTDDSSNVDKLMYPVQRKSDGLCGLYDVLNNVFYPMQGTNITTNAAGPTINENPNWSPIVIYGTFTATGGDESKGYSNTYTLPGGVGSWPVSVDTVTNIPDDAQYAYISFKMHAGSLNGTQSGARNRFIVDGSTVQTSSAYQDGQVYKVDAINRTVTNKYYSLANSVTFAIIETREASSAEHSITFEFDKTNHKIKCTADAAQSSVQGGAKCWFSNIEIVIFR